MDCPFYNTIIIGSGAAGYAAALRLKQNEKSDCVILTEGVNCGTSRNTGSDKQTYYKLSLSGETVDSVKNMADTLFAGGAVDGDNALAEAACSVRCFMNLCELGVSFPHNRYGEYIGYKTDHDPFERATSAGPYTSKFMTEALEAKVKMLEVPVLDSRLAVKIIKNEKGVQGLICLNTESNKFEAYRCNNIIIATGGPAGIYEDSVYPTSHTGFSSLALTAGASMQNLTEWQYGMASINPRWNVSGTYMQVLPRLVSVDKEGNEYEFTEEFFEDKYEALSLLFLKGYQWPFDCKKVMTGSSVIDLLVYKEKMKGRRVYLDFMKNPFGMEEIEFNKLSEEAYTYLKKAGADFGTPIERLRKMNAPAINLYKDKGTDITGEYLEISLCAQHNNGGISVDKWWQTDIEGLFAIGECAGTHGIVRPGGTALNAGQVGALRAAQYIGTHKRCSDSFDAEKEIEKEESFCKKAMENKNNVLKLIKEARQNMSENAAAIRNKENMEKALMKTNKMLENFGKTAGAYSMNEIPLVYKLKDTLIMQKTVLTAMKDFSETAGTSRGSALYTDKNGELRPGLDEIFRLSVGNMHGNEIQTVYMEQNEIKIKWRNVRPIPEEDNFFENVWNQYRDNRNVY